MAQFPLLLLILLSNILFVYSKSNIVLIITDDQDSLSFAPLTKTMKLVAGKGANMRNSFVNTPLCCPSRSTLLTGLYQHNTKVLNNSIEGNCNSKKWQRRYEDLTFASEIQTAGYRTFYAGKYLNQYGSQRGGGLEHIPKGWQWWAGLKGNSRYYNYTLSVNGTARHFRSSYLTDHIHEMALEFLKGQTTQSAPFLMMLAPPAPHAPYTPSPKYAQFYLNTSVPRTPNFNPPRQKDKHWMMRLPPRILPPKVLHRIDENWRQRWRTLMSVDDMVAGIIHALNSIGVLNNTFVMVTSDNGYHLGHYGLPWDKRQPYDTDIRVPLFIRGPGVKRQVVNNPVMTADIAPTLLEMAGLSIPSHMDGSSFLPLLFSKKNQYFTRTFLVEHTGEGGKSVSPKCPWFGDSGLSNCNLESACKCQDSKNNTYSCARTIGPTSNSIMCKFNDNENFLEAYDLSSDKYQMKNIAYKMKSGDISKELYILKKLQSCSGISCSIFNT